MSAITPRYSLKVRGLTAADAVLGTVVVAVGGDGFLRFTDAQGIKRAVKITGDLAILLREAFIGTGGYTATDVVGDRPVRTGPGVGGRVDY